MHTTVRGISVVGGLVVALAVKDGLTPPMQSQAPIRLITLEIGNG